ncbi:sodium-cholate efflux protein MrpF [Oceanobacillus picturae]|uniref:Sodium-cholate efflux protein MrpF n=1 Tax=Oceanobacillus picturae TaxID=171693 RepID=A0A0U9H9G5_9BACI|nr:Na(+)/H(+) antiporter subunit F1 [Oceanobacillus picturae]RIU93600.1 Na(+)/H(+) antiporter subunit F1 [Oceanobacillus picturae]GAQ19354.1 sodium-cholate efflux protein MrpF [Oceanobacillus picturae]
MTEALSITENILDIAVTISFAGIAISLLLLLYQVIVGPTQPDRAVALDAIGINIMALAGIMAVYLVTSKLNDVILLVGILAFLGTLSIAKYLEKGVIIDRDVD